MPASASPDLAVRLLSPEGSGHGPYVGLTTAGALDPFGSPLFTRATAAQITRDLEHDGCALTASWHGDVLRFTWSAEHDGTGGDAEVRPDEHGRYAIGGLWPWQEWSDGIPQTAGQAAYALGATHAPTGEYMGMPDGLVQLYNDGRAEALRLMGVEVPRD